MRSRSVAAVFVACALCAAGLVLADAQAPGAPTHVFVRAAATLTVTPSSASVMVGQTVQLTSSGGGGTVWSSSDSGIATVSASGLVTGVREGSATILARKGNKNGVASITVTANTSPVDCVPSAWSEWSACADGMQTRTRTVVMPASNGGASCDPLMETQSCTPPDGSNPLAASRLPAGDTAVPNPYWAAAGATIDDRTTICATLGVDGQSRSFAQSVTAAQIETAVANCGAGQVVKLETGTYTLTSGIDFAGKDNVTLRGEGADNTLIYANASTDTCLGQISVICIRDTQLSYYGPGPPANSATWSGGYSQGSTTVQLDPSGGAATLPNLSVGMWIHLDRLNDTAFTSDYVDCDLQYTGVGNGCTQQGGTENARTDRSQHQRVQVTSIEAGSCGTTGNGTCDVGINPPVYMPNIAAGNSPGAWWGNSGNLTTGNGVEDLSIDGTGFNASVFRTAIGFIFATNSWVKGVRVVNCPMPKTCVNIYGSNHITVRDSYFYGASSYSIGSTTYGVETYGSHDNLIVNNIFHHRTSPFVSDGDEGSVFAYNYTFDDFYNPTSCGSPCPFMQSSNYSHEAGNGMILHEGNEGTGGKADIIHGTSNLFTYLRNRFIGWEPNKTTETSPVILYAGNRYYNFLCNVLGGYNGGSAYHTSYAPGTADRSIWRLGDGYSGISGNPSIPSDALVASTLMRWGNWDIVTSTDDNGSNDQSGTRWASGEVPNGLSVGANPVPSSQSCPVSLFLSAKPAWWGDSIPWPSIGPDVSSGNVSNTGGHVFKNPAHTCYDAMSDDTAYAVDASGFRPKRFDRLTCYPGS